jgi:hypothetical protein
MPHTLHQGVVALFVDDASLAFDLMRSVFGIDLPKLTGVTDRKGELDRYLPCIGDTQELRLDVALSADFVHPEHRRVGIAAIVEVQQKSATIKRWRLWVYWALLAERLKRNTAVMVVPLSKSVSRWSRSLGAHEIPSREALLVLDYQNMPRITDPEQARQRPAMAVLSVLIHAINGDIEFAQMAYDMALGLADDRRWRYASIILSAMPKDIREQMKAGLTMEERHELTELELNSVAYHDGKDAGMLEGKLEILTDLLLTILELRQLPVDASTDTRIRACKDPALLSRWASRAKQIDDVTGLFD